jgi:hypothetical protein
MKEPWPSRSAGARGSLEEALPAFRDLRLSDKGFDVDQHRRARAAAPGRCGERASTAC